MNSIGNIVNNLVITLYDDSVDGNYTCGGDHFIVQKCQVNKLYTWNM